MKSFTRRLLCVGLAGLAMSTASAQSWPRQPLRVIIPNPAGSAPDVMMRIVSDRLALQLKTPVLVENRPGAGGIVAVQTAGAARDGHTAILMLTGVAVITPMVLKAAKYDVLKDFTPIAGIAETSLLMAASPNATARTILEIIKLATESPDKVVIGHGGVGTLSHLMAESFVQSSGAKFLIVPFTTTSGPLALVNGDAQYFIDGIASVLPFVKGGLAQPVAVFSSTTLSGLEEYKLAKDALPGAEAVGRFGLMAPKDTSSEAITAISSALAKVLAETDVVNRLREFATYPAYTSGAIYADNIRREQAHWAKVARKAGLQPQ